MWRFSVHIPITLSIQSLYHKQIYNNPQQLQYMVYDIQGRIFMSKGGERAKQISFAGPSFSMRPKYHEPPTIPFQKANNPTTINQLSPPEPRVIHPSSIPINTNTTTQTSNTSTTQYKTKIKLCKLVQEKVEKFFGRQCFGTILKIIHVLPCVEYPKTTHEDKHFFQDKAMNQLHHIQLR